MTWDRSWWLCMLVLVCGSPVGADPLPEQFTLGRYVPADVWMYTHVVDNPDSAFVDEYWHSVWAALLGSGISEDIKTLLLGNIDDPKERLKAEAQWSRVRASLGKVNWAQLVGSEAALAQRFDPPLPDLMLLFRPEEGTGPSLATALRSLLEEMGMMFGDQRVVNHDVNGVPVSTLPLGKTPMQLHLFYHQGIVGVAVGRKSLDHVTAALTGKPTAGSLMDSPRFRQAIARVSPPEDSVSFFDIRELFSEMRTLGRTEHSHAPDIETQGIAMLEAMFDQIDIIDTIVASESTDGYQQRVSSVVTLQSDAGSKPLAKALTLRKPFDRFDTFIPVQATGFSVSTGFGLAEFYRGALEFIEDNVPDGATRLAAWKRRQAEWGFNVERDLLSWLSGEIIGIQLTPTPGHYVSEVVMIRVRDPRLAAQKVHAAIDRVGQWFPQLLQGTAEATEVDADGFHLLRILPLRLMLKMEPVFGVYEDWLMVGTSAAAINECIATSRGAPSIASNDRFVREGLIPDGPVYAASFNDLTHFGEELGTLAVLVGTFSGMLLAQMPEDDPTPQIMFSIVRRVAGVLAEVDFLSSSSSVTTFDGTTWHTEEVTTYKTPKPRASTHSKRYGLE